ncbi:MAG: DUF5678 domain-containing protein [Nitrospiria bacterium]
MVKNAELYSGKYVAIRSFLDKEVVCAGDNPAKVYNEAKKADTTSPVIFYVPEKDMVHIY